MLTALGLACLLIAVVALVAHLVALPTRYGAVLSAGSPYAILAVPVAVLLLALGRAWWLLGVGVVVAVGGVATQATVWTPSRGRVTTNGPTVTVLQVNLLLGGADARAVVDRVRETGASILTVDELTVSSLERLHDAGLDDLLPHRFVAPAVTGGDGTGLWSGFPLVDQVNHDGFRLEVLSAVVQPPGANPVTVFATHLLPPFPYPSRTWNREMGLLRELLRQPTGAVIMGGDLNASWDHRRFRQLLGDDITDAVLDAGRGPQPTWPTDRRPIPPLLALDHWLLRGVRAGSAYTVELPGSDHRGLVAVLHLPAADAAARSRSRLPVAPVTTPMTPR